MRETTMNTRNNIKTTLSVICLAGILAVAGSAKAITYSLNVPNSGLSGVTGPYGQVTISLIDATHADITFTTTANAAGNFLLSDGSTVDLNVNGPVTVGTITGSGQPQTPNAPPAYTVVNPPGVSQVDGFGKFNLVIDNTGNPNGFQSGVQTVNFSLTLTSGAWLSDAGVLTGNLDGKLLAAHVYVATPSWANTGVTGFATTDGTSPTPPVPDGGSTVALLGFAVLALGSLRRIISRN